MNYRTRALPLTLNAVGMVAVGYAFFANHFAAQSAWLVAAFVFALITWATTQLTVDTRRYTPVIRGVRLTAIFLGVIVTSLSQAPTFGVHTAPLAVILILAISDERESIWVGAAAAVLAFALTPVGAAIAPVDVTTALTLLAGDAVWVLIGVSRRQARQATRRNRELLEQQQAAHVQETRAAALAARQAAARDIHDVLAHSLGGLVVQLDATEALLEAGRTADAAVKVAQARRLAADGLTDARRAVAALRSPDETDASELGPVDLAGAAERLFRAHRELGGEIDAHVDLTAAPSPLPAPVATAFERALQEALSNARRHAPGAPVAAELVASPDRIELTVSNPARPDAPHSDIGGGHGITGMTERFAALDGGVATAALRDGRFVVSASTRVARG